MSDAPTPHPKNARGPFYVEYGCCTACGVPETVAPEHFGWDDDMHCFVKRQPITPAEVDRMLEAVARAELNCIRYRGRDPELAIRFAELGAPQLCDFAPRTDLKSSVRNHVAFVDMHALIASPAELAQRVRARWAAQPLRFDSKIVLENAEHAALELSWPSSERQRVVLSRIPDTRGAWLIHHEGPRGLSRSLHEALVAEGFTEIQWHTAESWLSNGPARRTPY